MQPDRKNRFSPVGNRPQPTTPTVRTKRAFLLGGLLLGGLLLSACNQDALTGKLPETPTTVTPVNPPVVPPPAPVVPAPVAPPVEPPPVVPPPVTPPPVVPPVTPPPVVPPPPSGVDLKLGQSYSFKTVTPGINRYLRQAASLGVTSPVTASSPDTLKQEASWKVVAGLADPACFSFEAGNQAGKYLHPVGGRLRVDAVPSGDATLFNNDATYCSKPGLDGLNSVSLYSKNAPNSYIRHRNAELWLDAKAGNNTLYNQDASWSPVAAWTDTIVPPPPPPPLAAPSLTPAGLVFSGVKSLTSVNQTVTLARLATPNTRQAELNVTALSVTGTDAAAFEFDKPTLPLKVGAGNTLPIALRFVPNGKVGVLKATLKLELQGEGALEVKLSGLSTEAEEGENEPPLASIVGALGYGIDVGGTNLILGTDQSLIGQEIASPLFRKLGSGPVTLRPVARYSPKGLESFGFFTLKAGQPADKPVAVSTVVGVIASTQSQTLNPGLDSSSPGSGSLSFDPAGEPFGIYVAPTDFSPTADYSLDTLNPPPTSPVSHAVRVYPLRDESGNILPGYLLAFEAAANGDYQDSVFVLTGAEAASTVPTTSAAPSLTAP